MKRLWVFVIVAGIAVWGGALIDFSHPRGAATVTSAPEPSAVAPFGPSMPPRTSAAGKTRALASPGAQVNAPQVAIEQTEPASNAQSPSALHSVGKMARALMNAARGPSAKSEEPQPAPTPAPAGTGELGEGVLSPEYNELARHYVDEARNAEWAVAHEQSIRNLLHDQALESKVALVNCQETVCRIVLETDSPDAFRQLLATPGLSQATTLSATSPYSLRSGQLSVFFHPSALSAPQ